MSIIYGCIDFKASVDRQKVINEIYKGCCDFRHVENKTEQFEEIASLGAMRRCTTLESQYDKSPFTYKHLTICSYSRLDNREVLAKRLGITFVELVTVPDSVFIVKAYEKWGEECLKYLDGDWVFSIWDSEKEDLYLAKDFHGQNGVFYYRNSNFFAFCSSLKGLINSTEVPKELNINFLIASIANTQTDKGEFSYENIFYLPPCHYLKVSKNDFQLVQYWTIDDVKLIHYSSKTDYYEHFLELYTIAVKERMRYPSVIGSTLSGGLDSGSVSVLASNILKEHNTRLPCFTSVPSLVTEDFDTDTYFTNEREYALATSEFNGNIDINLIRGGDYNVLDLIKKEVNNSMSPAVASGNLHWFEELHTLAKAKNIGVLLNGQSGNNTISWAGKKVRGRNFTSIMNSLIISVLPFTKGINAKRNALKFGESVFTKSIYENYSIGDKICDAHNEWVSICDKSSIVRRDYLEGFTSSYNGVSWQNAIFETNIDMIDPTSDKDLVEFCLGIPDSIYTDNFRNRSLIRTSMESLLPDKVRLNPKRAIQGIDNWKRIVRDTREIECFFESQNRDSSFGDFFNKEFYLNILKDINKDKSVDSFMNLGNTLLDGIAIASFLGKF